MSIRNVPGLLRLLRDVVVGTPSDGDAVVWDEDTEKFVVEPVEGGEGGGSPTQETLLTNQTAFIPTTDFVFVNAGISEPTSIVFAPVASIAAKTRCLFVSTGAAGPLAVQAASGENFAGRSVGDTLTITDSGYFEVYMPEDGGQLFVLAHSGVWS